ncbi:hypothetical protein TeGR_g2783 [Tetraparma gracilis]|uniref:ATP-dependent RNA helicase n=1 Tax=Tetraparma gracilis TaxID=2962635 RepID=A0ABQ6N5M5_9STRA|nr:hypothetical protein TeGR_g2783 [Tetraparma gracilis]
MSTPLPTSPPPSPPSALPPFPSTLPSSLLSSLASNSYLSPTQIQSLSLSSLLPPPQTDAAYFLHAPTGSGKTLAFSLPLLSRLSPSRSLQALVLCPTRELCVQTTWTLRSLAPPGAVACSTNAASSAGRLPGWLRADPPPVLVALPSALASLLKRDPSLAGRLRQLSTVVVDEVDAILPTPEGDHLRSILGRAVSGSYRDGGEVEGGGGREARTTVFASATLPNKKYFLKRAVADGWVGAAGRVEVLAVEGGSPGGRMPGNFEHE